MIKSLSDEFRHKRGGQHPYVLALLIMFVMPLVSCATTPTTDTEVTSSWEANSYNGKFANLLVISHAADPAVREKVESIMAMDLEKLGLHALASSDIMPANEKIDRKTIGAAISGKGFDGVLALRLIDLNRRTVDIQPSEDFNLGDSFDEDGPVVFSPDYVEHISVISIRTNLYDAVSKRLVWSLRSQTENFGTLNDLVQSVSQTVIKNLQGRGLI